MERGPRRRPVRALMADREELDALNERAADLIERGRFNKAEAVLIEAFEVDPDYWHTRYPPRPAGGVSAAVGARNRRGPHGCRVGPRSRSPRRTFPAPSAAALRSTCLARSTLDRGEATEFARRLLEIERRTGAPLIDAYPVPDDVIDEARLHVGNGA